MVAGLAHLEFATFEFYRINPPLIRMLATLPVFLISRPDSDSSGNLTSARSFLEANIEHLVSLFGLSRLVITGLSAVGCAFMFRWTLNIYGRAPACVAASLWCFSPSILAHAHLVTVDLGATVLAFTSTCAFWIYLIRRRTISCIVCGTLLGMAQLAKFTMLILYIAWPVTFVGYYLLARDSRESVSRLRTVGHYALMLLISVLVINAGYLFKGVFPRLGALPFQSAGFVNEDGTNRFKDTWVRSLPIPLPEDLLLGLDSELADLDSPEGSYLRGEWRQSGWWYYYVYALVIKEPVGTLLLFVLGVGVRCTRDQLSIIGKPIIVLLPGVLLLLLVSSYNAYTMHMRFALPLLPFAFVAASRCAVPLSRHIAGRLLLVALLASNFASVIRVHPHYLSYFNELAGGPVNGHKHLLDSNIDWGQDLFTLRTWTTKHPDAKPLKTACWGFLSPSLLGVGDGLPPLGVPTGLHVDSELSANFGPLPGWYAISVNLIHGMSWAAVDERGRLIPIPEGGLRYFQFFEPVDRVGYSILIYHITLNNANLVRSQLGLSLLEPGANNAP
jgi:hypothetical protein